MTLENRYVLVGMLSSLEQKLIQKKPTKQEVIRDLRDILKELEEQEWIG